MVFFSLRQLVLVLVLVVTFVLADSVPFTFDNSDTLQPQASIAWGPSKLLDGELDGCETDPQTAPNSCQGFWWTENNIDGAFNDTLQVAFGPKATLNFTFIGDSVQVWGVKYSVGANATYKLDGGAPSTFSTFSDSEEPQFQQLLLSLPNLQAGTHSLVISYDKESFGPTGDRKLLNIDFFNYTIPSNLLSTILPVQATIAPKTHSHTKTSHKAKPTKQPVYAANPKLKTVSSSFLATAVAGSAPQITVNASSISEFSANSHPENQGPLVIGSILGLVAFLLLLLFTFFLCKQRREARALADKLGPVEAFVSQSPSSAHTSRTLTIDEMRQTSRALSVEEAQQAVRNFTAEGVRTPAPTYDVGLSFASSSSSLSSSSKSSMAGGLPGQPLAGEAALPPSYHQATRQWTNNGPPPPPVPPKEEKKKPKPLKLA